MEEMAEEEPRGADLQGLKQPRDQYPPSSIAVVGQRREVVIRGDDLSLDRPDP